MVFKNMLLIGLLKSHHFKAGPIQFIGFHDLQFIIDLQIYGNKFKGAAYCHPHIFKRSDGDRPSDHLYFDNNCNASIPSGVFSLASAALSRRYNVCGFPSVTGVKLMVA